MTCGILFRNNSANSRAEYGPDGLHDSRAVEFGIDWASPALACVVVVNQGAQRFRNAAHSRPGLRRKEISARGSYMTSFTEPIGFSPMGMFADTIHSQRATHLR
jgi:hypothetical protein